MGSISKVRLNATNLPILVVDDSTPGTTIFAATSTINVLDEVWLYASNNSIADVSVTLVYDDGSDTPVEEVLLVRALSKVPLIIGVPVNTLTLSAYTITGDVNKILVTGFINRITP